MQANAHEKYVCMYVYYVHICAYFSIYGSYRLNTRVVDTCDINDTCNWIQDSLTMIVYYKNEIN